MLPPERMKLITPSKWLADLVKLSFLKKYSVEVVHNTVNADVFKPTLSDFRERYGIGDRFMVLGVAAKWSERKGLPDFVKLAKALDKDTYAVVVVGLSKRQIKQVKEELIALPRTESMEELAGIYTTSDVLVNPSPEETYGMNVAEATACGTRSIVIKGSACAEVAQDALLVSPDLSDLAPTIVKLRGGGCDSSV